MFSLISSTIILLSIGYSHASCSSSNCAGHYTLTHSSHRTVNITGDEFTATIKTIKPTIAGYTIILQRYINYEYEGGALDKNSGCKPQYDFPPIHQMMAHEWSTRMQCQIGKVCQPDSDCWGSSSDWCLEPKNSMLQTWVTSKKFNFAGKCWYFFPHHTCVMDWACDIKKYEYPTTLVGMEKISTSISNGTSIILDPSKNLLNLGNGVYLYFKASDIISLSSKETCTIKCIMTDKTSTSVCVTANDCTKVGIPLSYNEGYWCNRNLCATRKNRVNIIKLKEMDKTASKMDLQELRTFLQAEINRVDINTVEMLKHLDDFEKVFLNLVNHIAKTDPLLLGKLISKPIMTQYMDSNQFTMCPCEFIQPLPHTICNNKEKDSYIFRNGEFTLWDKKTQCFRPLINKNDHMVKPVQLIKNTEINTDSVEVPDIVGASFEWQGWQWLTNYQETLEWTMKVTKEQSVSGLLDTFSSPVFGLKSLMFNFISSYVSWIALVLSIITCLKG